MKSDYSNSVSKYSVEIDGNRSGLRFSAAHFIHNHPTCGRLHGHDFSVSVRIDGAPDSSGIVVDFIAIESLMKSLIADLDHKIVVAKRWASVKDGIVRFETNDGEIRAPLASTCIIEEPEITSELLAHYLLGRVLSAPDGIMLSNVGFEVGVSESEGRVAWSRYKQV